MDFENLFQHQEYENYVCVYLALVLVCKALKPYTENGLQQVHQDIKNKLAGKSKCTGICEDQPSKWCQPCKSWQKPLQSHCTKRRPIDWTKHTTANWEESFENIASVFTTLPGDGTPANYLDLSNACSIWERCKAFKMKKVVINNVRKCRNKYFAHNDTLRVDGNGKAEVFDALRDLLNDKDVGSHIDKRLCMDKLQKIMNTSCLQNTISNIKKDFDHQSEKTIESLSKSTAMVSENCEILKEIYVLAMFVFIAVAFTIAGRYISGNNKPDWNGISSNNMANNIFADALNQKNADFHEMSDASAILTNLALKMKQYRSSVQANVACDKRIPRSLLETRKFAHELEKEKYQFTRLIDAWQNDQWDHVFKTF